MFTDGRIVCSSAQVSAHDAYVWRTISIQHNNGFAPSRGMCVYIYIYTCFLIYVQVRFGQRMKGIKIIQTKTIYCHRTKQKVQLSTNASFIHERYNDWSCERDHTLSSGTREDTRLDTQMRCLTNARKPTEYWPASRKTQLKSTSKQWMHVRVPTHDLYTNNARNAVSSKHFPPTPTPFEMQSQNSSTKLRTSPISNRMHVPWTTKHLTNVLRWPNCVFKCFRVQALY